jgi:hypothetical protein
LLKPELQRLEKIIAEISDSTFRNKRRTPRFEAEKMKLLNDERQRLKERWAHAVFTAAKEPAVKRYIQFHQACITNLSAEITRIMLSPLEQAAGAGPSRHFYLSVLAELELLLAYLKDGFYAYFDEDQRLTSYHAAKQAVAIRELLHELKKTPRPDKTDPAMMDAIYNSLQEFAVDMENNKLSYRQAEQVARLLRVLQPVQDWNTAELTTTLYRYNLRTGAFVAWFRHWLAQKMKKLPASDRKLFFEQIGYDEKPRPSGEGREPSGWEVQQEEPAGRLPLTLSVAQFGLLVRLLQLAGCFPDTNISRIQRFFTGHFATKKQTDISNKSFSRAFYSSSQTTAAVVRDLLHRMIIYIDKTWFP